MAHPPSSPFRIPVSDLLQAPGRRRVVTIDAAVAWGLELSRVEPAEPLRGELSLESVSSGIVVRGRLPVHVRHTCNRCTGGWEEDLVVEVTELLGTQEGDDYRLEDDVADLEDPIRDAVLLALPLVPLCRPNCAGLCAVCGADLNTGSCPGHQDESDSPFAVLRGLLEP